ncbi:MAG: hypothetical protein WCW53_01740 [Syntrophales bacterium]
MIYPKCRHEQGEENANAGTALMMNPADVAQRQRCHRLGKGLLALVLVLAVPTFNVPACFA